MLPDALIKFTVQRQQLRRTRGKQTVNKKRKEAARVDTARINKTSTLMYQKSVVSSFFLYSFLSLTLKQVVWYWRWVTSSEALCYCLVFLFDILSVKNWRDRIAPSSLLSSAWLLPQHGMYIHARSLSQINLHLYPHCLSLQYTLTHSRSHRQVSLFAADWNHKNVRAVTTGQPNGRN